MACPDRSGCHLESEPLGIYFIALLPWSETNQTAEAMQLAYFDWDSAETRARIVSAKDTPLISDNEHPPQTSMVWLAGNTVDAN